MEETKIYDGNQFSEVLVEETIKQVVTVLEKRGYDPINQIVGYLMSGDPGYISNHKNARKMITSIERTKILEVLVKNYIK